LDPSLRTTCICIAVAAYCCGSSFIILLRRLLAVEILGKLPLDSAWATRLLSERVHHPHVLFVAPGRFVVVVVEVVLLVVRATASTVAVCSALAVKFVVGGEFIGGVVCAVVVLGWDEC
jgi:hypothetical protein